MRYLVSYKATYLDQREISADNEEHAKSLVEEALSHSHASKYEVTKISERPAGICVMTAENIALALWLAFIAACIMAFYLLADAATLSMTGSCTGRGFSNITIEADILMASINQTANGTSWQIWGAPA